MLKDGNLIHRSNKQLLSIIGLAIIILFTSFYIFDHFKKPKVAEQTPVEQIKTAVDSVPENNIGNYEQGDLGQIKNVRAIDATDHLWGDLGAKVQIIIYDDFSNAYSADYFDIMEQVKKDYTDKVAIAFRHYPLTNIHPVALIAAEASECAAEQNKFWEMEAKLFADNRAGKLLPEQFKQDAISLGLDKNKFTKCLDEETYRSKIEAQLAEANTFGVTGAPTTFVNSQIIIGANPLEDVTASDGRKIEGLKTIINKLLNQ